MKIIVDAMGGDNAPLEIVKGALQGRARWGVDIVLTGDAAQQTSGEAGEQAQAVDYTSLPLDAEGYPVE